MKTWIALALCLVAASASAQAPPIPVQNGGTGVATITGAIKGSGTSAFSQAASTDLSDSANIGRLNGTNVWSAQQSTSVTALSISTATFTPNGTNNNYGITLVHASCPCTVANPSATPVAGTSGVIQVTQSATGSDTIGTWGTSYNFTNGTPTLSTSANATNIFAYYVQDATHIWVDTPGGSGSVTTVSVASANGFAGTVATATTTPAITISTSITGALKGNGTAVSQAACADLSNGATGCSTATGTSGGTIPLLNGTNTWSGTQTFGTTVSTINTQSGTTYTLAATDCGQTILFTNGSAITLTTLNSLPVGCYINVEQGGAGQITLANGSGATSHSAHSYTKTFAQYAILGLFVDTNSGGTAADIIIMGDGA